MTEGIIQKVIDQTITRYKEYAIFNSFNTSRMNQEIAIQDFEHIKEKLIAEIKTTLNREYNDSNSELYIPEDSFPVLIKILIGDNQV